MKNFHLHVGIYLYNYPRIVTFFMEFSQHCMLFKFIKWFDIKGNLPTAVRRTKPIKCASVFKVSRSVPETLRMQTFS